MATVKDLEILEEDITIDLLCRFLKKVDVMGPNECWMWTGGCDYSPNKLTLGNKSYGKFFYKGKTIKAHRMSYAIFKGPIKNDLIIKHSCDCPGCVNPRHLEIGTQSDNLIECVNKCRKNTYSKLSEEDVKLIKNLKGSKIKFSTLAHLFNIGKSTICDIQLNKTWKHVTI